MRPRSSQVKPNTISSNSSNWFTIGVPATRVYKAKARSKITNGRTLLPGIDQRTLWVRRYRDLLALHVQDLGGDSNISEAERAIIRRACCLILECEQREVKFAKAGAASNFDIEVYQRLSNTMRRLLESVGLQRRPRDVTPTLQEYLRTRQQADEADDAAEVSQ